VSVEALESSVDQLLGAVFGSPSGRMRLDAACTDYDACVGTIFEDDHAAGILRLLRADWALFDFRGADGERWIDRCARGEIIGADVDDAQRLGRTLSGAFEVWPGREVWLRDRIRGLCLRLVDPIEVGGDGSEAAALWDARVWLTPAGARLCRIPLVYPEGALELLCQRQRGRTPGSPWPPLPELRRAFVRWYRARGRQPFAL